MRLNRRHGPVLHPVSPPRGFRHSRLWRSVRTAAEIVAVYCYVCPLAVAQSGQPITRIEEDWKVTFGDPDPELNAPQVSITMAPSSDLASNYCVFEINHHTQPDYAAGGLQLLRFVGDGCVDFKNSHKQGVAQISGDVVTFTMSMEVQNGSLSFGVSNGNSQSWGTFGNGGWMTLSTSYGPSSLSSYNASTSLNNSRVGFAPNRVQQVVRTQVRYFANGTLVATDSTQQPISQYSSASATNQ